MLGVNDSELCYGIYPMVQRGNVPLGVQGFEGLYRDSDYSGYAGYSKITE
jgi:hypothetical protein